jgi:hypothetical protein
MKKFNKIFICCLTLFSIMGCKKILEPTIYTAVNADNFPTTEADAKSAIIPFYAQFNMGYGTNNVSNNTYEFGFNSQYVGYAYVTSVQTDERFDLTYSPYATFTLGAGTALNNTPFAFYNRLSQVGKMTDLIDRLSKSSIANKDQYIAEVKGLRGWYLFILWDLYGPSNPRLDPATVNSLINTPRLSEADYVAAMTSDLDAAIAVLPVKYNGTANWGRVSKAVASMILLKVYMQEAGKTGDAAYWTKAQTVGQSLLGMGFSLDSSYKDVFATPQNNEVIYAVPGNSVSNNSTSINTSIWFSCIIPYDAKTILGQDVTVNQNYKLGEMPWGFYDKYTATDTRLQTIASSYVNTSGVTIDRAHGLDAAIPMKYPFKPNGEGFDFVMFQYSDVLLSMAEITNELKGPTSEAVGYLQQVTDRAQTIIPATAKVSHDALSNFILDERGRELYWETGLRRQDMLRHGTFISAAVARGLPAKDFNKLFPIPSDVIIQSNGFVKQNPGY